MMGDRPYWFTLFDISEGSATISIQIRGNLTVGVLGRSALSFQKMFDSVPLIGISPRNLVIFDILKVSATIPNQFN